MNLQSACPKLIDLAVELRRCHTRERTDIGPDSAPQALAPGGGLPFEEVHGGASRIDRNHQVRARKIVQCAGAAIV